MEVLKTRVCIVSSLCIDLQLVRWHFIAPDQIWERRGYWVILLSSKGVDGGRGRRREGPCVTLFPPIGFGWMELEVLDTFATRRQVNTGASHRFGADSYAIKMRKII